MHRAGITGRPTCRAVCLLLWLAAGGVTAAEEGWRAEGRAVAPDLDLEVWVGTSLRLSQPHTALYTEKLLVLGRELFGAEPEAQPEGEPEGKRRPTYCVTIDHSGSIALGTRALVRKARGQVFREGELVGGGEDRRWILPVRRRCTIRFALYKRDGDSYLALARLKFPEPPSWEEQLYGGLEVASEVRAAGEPRPTCPVTREQAHEKALTVLEPPRYHIKAEIVRRLLDVRIVQLLDHTGSRVHHRTEAGLYTARVTLENRTPWYLQRLQGRFFGTCRGIEGVYGAELNLNATVPPGGRLALPCRATEYAVEGDPPCGHIRELKWSLKAEP